METSSIKSQAMLTHLSTLTQYFIPFGNFIFPIILWSINNKKSEFLDKHGKSALNFQLSIFLYCLVLVLISIPIFIWTVFSHTSISGMIHNEDIFFEQLSIQNITGFVILGIVALSLVFFMKLAEFFLIIYASAKAADGQPYRYPLSIPFLK